MDNFKQCKDFERKRSCVSLDSLHCLLNLIQFDCTSDTSNPAHLQSNKVRDFWGEWGCKESTVANGKALRVGVHTGRDCHQNYPHLTALQWCFNTHSVKTAIRTTELFCSF